MSASLEIREIPEGLSIHVVEARQWLRIAFILIVGCFATYLFVWFSFASRLIQVFAAIFCVYSIAKGITAALRGTDVKLLVVNLDLTSSGHAQEGYEPSIISRADIERLEFRKATGGGDEQEQPRGLYIEYRDGIHWAPATCVLPHINEQETEKVMEAIYRRFPDTGTLVSREPYLISLNLSQPKEPESSK